MSNSERCVCLSLSEKRKPGSPRSIENGINVAQGWYVAVASSFQDEICIGRKFYVDTLPHFRTIEAELAFKKIDLYLADRPVLAVGAPSDVRDYFNDLFARLNSLGGRDLVAFERVIEYWRTGFTVPTSTNAIKTYGNEPILAKKERAGKYSEEERKAWREEQKAKARQAKEERDKKQLPELTGPGPADAIRALSIEISKMAAIATNNQEQFNTGLRSLNEINMKQEMQIDSLKKELIATRVSYENSLRKQQDEFVTAIRDQQGAFLRSMGTMTGNLISAFGLNPKSQLEIPQYSTALDWSEQTELSKLMEEPIAPSTSSSSTDVPASKSYDC